MIEKGKFWDFVHFPIIVAKYARLEKNVTIKEERREKFVHIFVEIYLILSSLTHTFLKPHNCTRYALLISNIKQVDKDLH